MKKIILIIIITLIQINLLEAKRHLTILSSDLSQFPIVSTEYYYFSKNFIPFDFLKNENFKVTDNNSVTKILSIEKYQQYPISAISPVIAFDLAVNSESKKLSDFHLGQYIAKTFSRQLKNQNYELALTSFDIGSYLNISFSKDSASFESSVDKLFPSHISNFDAAFYKKPAGAISLSMNSKHKKAIILISDRKSLNNYHFGIEQQLKEHNIILYCFTIGYETQKEFKQICETTGGLYFENISDSSDVEKSVFTCLADLYEYKPLKLNWEAKSNCQTFHHIDFEVVDSNATNQAILDYPKESMPVLEIEPKFLGFSAVLQGSSKELDVVLTAKNDDIVIHDLSFLLPVFTIVKGGLTSANPTLRIKENTSHTLTIRFSPVDSSLVFDSLNIGSNACSNLKLLVTGGFPNTPPKERNLTIIAPTCSETLIAGDTISVEWTGLLPNDVIQLEYSINDGMNWDVLGKNVNGLKYNWVVPKTLTKEFKIRALQLWPNNVGQTMDFNHNNLVHAANFNELGDMIVSCSNDSNFVVWNSNNGYLIHKLKGHKAKVNWVNFSSDGKYVVSASDDSTAIIWDVSKPEVTLINPLYILKGHKSEVKSANFSTSGKYVVTAGWDGNLKLWNTENGQLIRNITKETHKLMYAEFSRDDRYLISCGNSSKIKVWNTESWLNEKTLTFYNGTVLNANFSSDGKKVVSSGWLGMAVVWDFEKGDTLFTVSHSMDTSQGVNAVNSAFFDKSGDYFLTTAVDNTARMWNSKTGELVKTLKEHRSNVVHATMNFDGSRILTSSWDSTAKIWNLDKRDLQTDSIQCSLSIDVPLVDAMQINLGDVVVGTSKYFLLDTFLINRKEFSVKVKDIVIKGKDAENFAIISGQAPYILDSLAVSNIEILFNPKRQGLMEANLEIYLSGLTLNAKLLGSGYEPELTAMIDEIDFGKVELGDFKDSTLNMVIKNTSAKKVNITGIFLAGPDNVHFRMNTKNNTIDLMPNETYDIGLRFLSNELKINSSKVVFLYDGLGQQSVIALFGEGVKPRIDSALIVVENYEAEQDRIVEIPIKLKYISQNGFRETIEGFNIELKFNGTMLEPLFYYNNSTVEGKSRILSLTLPASFDSDKILFNARFRVTLGNDTITPLEISNLQMIGKGKTFIELESGQFKLNGYCTKGGTRLFDSDGKMVLFQNRPNPFETSTVIEFEVFEPGNTRLYVMDMLGKVVREIVDYPLSKGTHSYEISVPELPNGSYYYILQTPTYRMSKRMEISR
jgi:WD40 repeat protein